MADRPVGAAKIVLSLDPTNLEKQLVGINDKLTSGMASIDNAYKALGTKSGPAFEAMKANAVAAMNAITASGKQSNEELIRIQQAAALKIQNITEQQYKAQEAARAKFQTSSAEYWLAEARFAADSTKKMQSASAEYWMAERRYRADAKKEAEAAAKAPWQTLGVQSVAAINQQKEAVRTAYAEITKSADLSHRDIVNLERAKNDKLKALNREMVGGHEMSMAAMMRAVLRFYAAWYVASTAASVVAAPFEKGFKAVEEFNTAVASSAAMVMSFSEKQNGMDIADQWKSALKYSRDLVPVLEKIAARTLLSGQEVTALNSAFAAQGVFLNSQNKDQVEAFSRVANALPLMTQGSEIMRQINTEIRSLMQGTNESTSSLLRNLKEMDPNLEKNLKTWREQNTVLENIGRLLVGFGYSTSILEVQWQAVKSTLDTTVTQTLRGGMDGAYKDIIKSAQALNDVIEKNQPALMEWVAAFGSKVAWIITQLGNGVSAFSESVKNTQTLEKGLAGTKAGSDERMAFLRATEKERQEIVAALELKKQVLSLSDSEMERILTGADKAPVGKYTDPEKAKELKKAEEELAKFEEDRLKKISEANRKAGEESQRKYDQKEKSITDYIRKLQQEIDSIGLDASAKERLEAREKGLSGARLASVDAMITQKNASIAAWKAADEANDAIAKNIADGEAMAIKGDADRAKKAIADAEKLLQDKMTLYKDLEGFENEYRDVQLEWIEKIRQAEIKAGLDKEAVNKKAYESEIKLNQELFDAKTQAISDGFGDLSSAFSGISKLYAEGSDDAEKWQAASDAMLIAQKAVAVVDAVVAVARSAQAPWPAGFVSMAAMAAAMGSLLGSIGESIGGSGSSSSTTATKPTATNYSGTVLGDITKSSESITNVTDLMSEIHADEYPELQGIRQEMIELNNNITGLVSSIVQNGGTFDATTVSSIGSAESAWMKHMEDGFNYLFQSQNKAWNIFNMTVLGLPALVVKYLGGEIAGGIFGGDSKTWKTAEGYDLGQTSIGELTSGGGVDVNAYANFRTKVDGGWFDSDEWFNSTQTAEVNEDIKRMFTSVFTGIGEALTELGTSLGASSETIRSYVFDIGQIDLMGLTGEEISAKLEAVISTAADTAAGALFEGIKQYQQVGEGLYETAARLVVDKEVVLGTLDAIGKGFAGFANSMDAVAFSEELLTIAGDLETFTESVSGYFSAFFSEAEQFAVTSENLKESFANIGLQTTFYESRYSVSTAFPETREAFKSLVDSLDLTTDAGKSAFVAMMNLADAADSFYDASEKAAEKLIDDHEKLRALRSKWEDTNAVEMIADRYGVSYADATNRDLIADAYQKFLDDPQALVAVAEKYGQTTDQVISDLGTLMDAILAAGEAAEDTAEEFVDMRQAYKDYASFQMTLGGMDSKDVSLNQLATSYKWGDKYGSTGDWDMESLYRDGIKPFLDMPFEDFQKMADSLGLTYGELESEVNILFSAFSDLSTEVESSMNTFKDLSESIRDQILGMQTSSDNQADVYERLGIQKAALSDMLGGQSISGYLGGLGSASEQADAIQKIQDLYADQLTLSQEAYERPSTAYQNEYSTVLSGLNELLGFSDIMKSEYELQYEQSDYLRQIVENTAALSSIPQYASGGSTGPGGLAILHPDEWVLDKDQTEAFLNGSLSPTYPITAVEDDRKYPTSGNSTTASEGGVVNITINAYGGDSKEVANEVVSLVQSRFPSWTKSGPVRVSIQEAARGK